MQFKRRNSAIVIGIDDVHPESSKDGSDCGGDLDKGALGRLENFLQSYTKVKVTLFVTPCHIFLPQLPFIERFHKIVRAIFGNLSDQIFHRFFIKTFEPTKYDIEKSEAFNLYLKSLVRKKQIEIGVHGCFHFNNIPPYSAEFKYLNKTETHKRVKIACKKLAKTGIPFVKGFAPPGWGVSRALLEVLAEEGFIYIAGSADFKSPIYLKAISNEAGIKGVSLIFPTRIYSNLINIPRNWTPHRNDLERGLRIVQLGGLLSVHMHVENDYHGVSLKNGLTEQNLKKLGKLIDAIEDTFGDSVDFLTFSEVIKNSNSNLINSSSFYSL
jgi:peptidoglycan/xylan/chitin deacetylase (PgdA/CDA1 family)